MGLPAVTFSPRIYFIFTVFHIFEPPGGSTPPPYFHAPGLNGPWLVAPAGAVVRAPLSLPAGAASGNCVAPGRALLAYGSALGGGCCAVWPANAAIVRAPNRTPAMSRCFTSILL